ncbi:hypothetical protein [Agrococcus sp. KRD186]|uniref:hypothetical protein n=1 Tax=Agrococcus sp. KRD186 TaxID=2729730 RepID=UPI0019D06970|nr:hypothetical protein [Agrococcus sp. KRD186]
MTKSQGWLLVLGTVIVAQIAVPTIALMHDAPARFGFQMYSGYHTGSITVLDYGGTEIDVEFNALLPTGLRSELDWERYIPEHICSEVTDAATITIQRADRPETNVPCR